MLVTLDLCLGARRLILTLAGTAVDFVVDRLTGFVLFQCFCKEENVNSLIEDLNNC